MHPTIEDIREAHQRIRPYIHRTPVLTCQSLNQISGTKLYFKCENLQKIGAFKIRGAFNAISQLTNEQLQKGVTTHSSGNHGAAVALAARFRKAKAYVIMPDNSSAVKIRAVQGYGAEVIFCTSNLESRETTAEDIIARTGACFIHPYNDAHVIAGQGTTTLELLEDAPALDIVIPPLGGGGLTSGAAIVTQALAPQTQVIAAEPKGADDAFRSFKAGKWIPMVDPQTIADGLRSSTGDLTFAIIKEHVADIVTVEETTIIQAMKLIWERMKILVEPSAAVPFAAILENRDRFQGQKIGILLSGGNIDLDQLPWVN